ncbi:hypothetical protein VNPA120719_33740 [Pseudomonas aeruginosa]|nr:hypothetical protein VNPA110516_18090 [Pseudomonas aeruginosa]GLE74866.1 hypothetical protein VNPA120641_17320 [Pseudomonas aeruginosa]GLE89984.1 hypothetical protein VNPA120719_33740 [Pseudomonas aeruginosa]
MKGFPIKIDACARDAGKTLGAGLAPLKRGPFGQAKGAPLIYPMGESLPLARTPSGCLT